MERILWIDAICINQDEQGEKEQQVRCMAKIYAKASRVIVWLGEAADCSDQALEVLRAAAEEQHANTPPDEANRQAVLALLGREWFQRIWVSGGRSTSWAGVITNLTQVLQEVAAARHILIKCGSAEIDGHAFCSGLSALKPFHPRPDLRTLVSPIAYLIRGAIFRRRYNGDEISRPGSFSLNICALSELVDMYHTRKATDPLDKVYALQGMCLDDLDAAGLSANYRSSWKDLFRKLVNFCLSDQVSVSTWDDEEVAVIEAKGYILGEVSKAGQDATRQDRQHVEITWRNKLSSCDSKQKPWISHYAFQASAKAINNGDVVCLLQGASKPTIIRLCDSFSAVIMIAAPLKDDLPGWPASSTTFPTDLLLVWDWDESGKMSRGESYWYFVNSRVPKCLRMGCRCQDYLDEATRIWNLGMLLNRMERYEEAVKNLRSAVEVYATGAAMRGADDSSPAHGPWREVDARALRIMDDLLVDGKGAAIEAVYMELGQTPLRWAAEEGREAVVRFLAENGADFEAKDHGGLTPLQWAAKEGHEAIVRLLVENGADIDAGDEGGQQPLALAAENGHRTVVKLLLATGKADINSKDRRGRTALLWAARHGYDDVIWLLLAGEADADSKDREYGRTPLSWAAGYGHEGAVKLLLATGKANVDSKDRKGRTALSWAARYGYEAVIKLLLATGKANVDSKNGRTPLSWAAENGHEAVVELLKLHGAH